MDGEPDVTTMAVAPTGFPRMDAGVVRQLARYVVVGALGTAACSLFYLVFRIWWDTVPANLAAIVLSTVLSTEANRRFTFEGARVDRVREYVQNAGTVAFYAVYSSVVLLLLEQVVVDPTALQETLTVAAASVGGGLARFLLLRNWVFGERHAPSGTVAV